MQRTIKPNYYEGIDEVIKNRLPLDDKIKAMIAAVVQQYAADCMFYLNEHPTYAGQFRTAEQACMNFCVGIEYAEMYRPRDTHPITLDPLDWE